MAGRRGWRLVRGAGRHREEIALAPVERDAVVTVVPSPLTTWWTALDLAVARVDSGRSI
jgi:hypothetical protein